MNGVWQVIKSQKKLIILCLQSVIVCACLYYIVVSFEWLKIGRVLQKANWFLFLFGAVISLCLYWLLRSLRWSLLLRHEKLHISFLRIYLYTVVTAGLAIFTPFQSGEAFKVELFRKYGGERISGYTFFLLEKLFDFFALSLLSIISVFVLFDFNGGGNLRLPIVWLAALLAVLTAAVVLFAGKLQEKLQILQRATFPNVKILGIVFLLTLAAWMALIIGWKFVLQSISVELSIGQTISVVSLTTIISILSLIPGAVGVSEVTIAALLSQLGYENPIAQAGAIMMGVYSLLILALAIIHLVILKVLNLAENKAKKNLKQIEKIV